MSANWIVENSGIKIFELLGSNDENRITAMLSLYTKFFPDHAHYASRMRRRAKLPSASREGHLVHYWLIEYQNKPVGLTTFRYISHRKCGLGIAFALDPSVRAIKTDKMPLSAFVIAQILTQLKADSKKMGNSEMLGLVTEVEHATLMERYKKLGMIELPIDYYEPIFPPENAKNQEIKFVPVFLSIMPSPNAHYERFSVKNLTNFALAFLVDHYNLNENHIKVQEVLRKIKDNSSHMTV